MTTQQQQQQQYTSALLAGPVTNWTKSLIPIYDAEARDRERHGQRLKQRDDRWLEIQKEESLVNRLGELSEFSQKIGGLVKQRREAKEASKEADELAFEVLYNKNITGKDQAEVDRIWRDNSIWQKDAKSLKIDGIQYTKLIHSSKLSDSAKQFLLTNHGSYALKIQNLLGSRLTESLGQRWQDHIDKGKTEDGKSFQVYFDSLGGDPDLEKQAFRKFIGQEYNKLGFNADNIANNYQTGINRWLETKEGQSALQYSNTILTDNEKLHEQAFESAKQNDNPNTLTQQLQIQIEEVIASGPKKVTKNADGKEIIEYETTYAEAGEVVANRLYRLGLAGKLEMYELELMKSGKALLKTPAGELGSTFLTDDQWARIHQGITEYGNKRLEGIIAEGKTNMVNTLSTLSNPKSTLSVEQKKALAKKALSGWDQIGGDQNDDVRKQLENFDFTVSNEKYYNDRKEELTPYFGGSKANLLLKDEAELLQEPNTALNNELEAEINKTKKFFKNVDAPTTWDDWVELGKSEIRLSESLKTKITPGDDLSEDHKNLGIMIALKKQEFLLQAGRENPNDNTRAKIVGEQYFKEWKASEGYHLIDDLNPKTEGLGILSGTIEGDFPRYVNSRTALAEFTARGTKVQSKIWSGHIIKGLKGQNLNTALDKAGSFTQNHDLLGVAQNYKRTGKMEFSPEIIYKAAALGIQPAELVRRQMAALKTSNRQADRDFYKANNFENMEGLLSESPTLDIEKTLMKMEQLDLLFHWNHGIEKMTPNQLMRLIHTLTGNVTSPYYANMVPVGN
tara:strand:- start:4426 stop:6804 length:2379 start_codon:yes stop_codon:yes gene_type:complete